MILIYENGQVLTVESVLIYEGGECYVAGERSEI